jgi:hypothetical protein
VVRADGSVVVSNKSMFSRGHDSMGQPGDRIVVPFVTQRLLRLPT